MPNPCMVCLHPAHALIDWQLLDQQAITDIARHFRLDPADIELHQAHHLDQALTQLAEADEPDVQQALERAQSWLNKELYDGAQTYLRAMTGWHRINDATDWHRLYDEAQQARQSGRFLLGQLGAGRFLAPDTMAVLTQMRCDLLAEYEACGPAAVLLVDAAVCTYYNALQFQRWQGDLALQLEREAFGQEGMEVSLSEKHGMRIAQGLKAEDRLRRMRVQFTSLCAQTHRQLMHTLQALERLRRSVPPGRVPDERPVQVEPQHVKITTYYGRPQTPRLTQTRLPSQGASGRRANRMPEAAPLAPVAQLS
jgi:hypothetical protein